MIAWFVLKDANGNDASMEALPPPEQAVTSQLCFAIPTVVNVPNGCST